jgi:hypothetical protein
MSAPRQYSRNAQVSLQVGWLWDNRDLATETIENCHIDKYLFCVVVANVVKELMKAQG